MCLRILQIQVAKIYRDRARVYTTTQLRSRWRAHHTYANRHYVTIAHCRVYIYIVYIEPSMLCIFRVDFMAATCEICDCFVCAGFVPCRLVRFVCVYGVPIQVRITLSGSMVSACHIYLFYVYPHIYKCWRIKC